MAHWLGGIWPEDQKNLIFAPKIEAFLTQKNNL